MAHLTLKKIIFPFLGRNGTWETSNEIPETATSESGVRASEKEASLFPQYSATDKGEKNTNFRIFLPQRKMNKTPEPLHINTECFYGNKGARICNYFELPPVLLTNHSQVDFCTLLLEL